MSQGLGDLIVALDYALNKKDAAAALRIKEMLNETRTQNGILVRADCSVADSRWLDDYMRQARDLP